MPGQYLYQPLSRRDNGRLNCTLAADALSDLRFRCRVPQSRHTSTHIRAQLQFVVQVVLRYAVEGRVVVSVLAAFLLSVGILRVGLSRFSSGHCRGLEVRRGRRRRSRCFAWSCFFVSSVVIDVPEA